MRAYIKPLINKIAYHITLFRPLNILNIAVIDKYKCINKSAAIRCEGVLNRTL